MAFDLQVARLLLLELGDSIRDKLIRARATASSAQSLMAISRESAADTIYEIDRVSEEVIETWFAKHWPREAPIELVMEGIDDLVTIPHGLPVEETMYKCILDPIDGTRGIMYDKRSAWFLAGLAPQKGVGTQLSDIEAAVMVELPTSKQWRADRISAVRGQGVKADSINVLTGEQSLFTLQPSTASDPWHGFAYISRFFPAGKALTALIEQTLWDNLDSRDNVVFEDQYLSSGGQFYELLTGHDRMIADIRPLVFRKLGIESALCCHPYDICSSLILREMNIVIEHPLGGQLTGPLDTISPVSWVAYANDRLAAIVRPAFQEVLRRLLNE
jgi:hypothetical protein